MTSFPGGCGKHLPDELLHSGLPVSEPGCSLLLPPKQRPGGPPGSPNSLDQHPMVTRTRKSGVSLYVNPTPLSGPASAPYFGLFASLLWTVAVTTSRASLHPLSPPGEAQGLLFIYKQLCLSDVTMCASCLNKCLYDHGFIQSSTHLANHYGDCAANTGFEGGSSMGLFLGAHSPGKGALRSQQRALRNDPSACMAHHDPSK